MISLKLENLARMWRIAWRFQIFLIATDLFLFIRDAVYAHIRQYKKILCCTNNCCVHKKKCFIWKLTLRNKIMWATKKYVVATKKKVWHPKQDSCCLNMFSVAQKRITCLQKMVPVAYKYMLNWLKMFRVAQKILWFNGAPNIHSVYRTSQPRCTVKKCS